ncbi:MAG: PEP-CTERM sorting domain-containing protein [Proteobacteria bacterium]|nr:PEP-CTERM sorting domain-containing protein [Pseudomonadota bacterium]
MFHHGRTRAALLGASTLGCAAIFAAVAHPAAADTIIYQNLPTNLAAPPEISFHNTTGPVIADDFVATQGGDITHLTWWGGDTANLQFEVVLQDNNPAAGEPALTPAGNNVTGGLKQFVTATQTSFSIPGLTGLFQYDADVAPGWSIAGGTDYWLTVANASDGWNWAEALNGPTIGSENFNAHQSTGPGCLDGGPHCGPWTDIHTDFAFQIDAVPEPTTWALMVLGFGGLGAMLRARKRPHTLARTA